LGQQGERLSCAPRAFRTFVTGRVPYAAQEEQAFAVLGRPQMVDRVRAAAPGGQCGKDLPGNPVSSHHSPFPRIRARSFGRSAATTSRIWVMRRMRSAQKTEGLEKPFPVR